MCLVLSAHVNGAAAVRYVNAYVAMTINSSQDHLHGGRDAGELRKGGGGERDVKR